MASVVDLFCGVGGLTHGFVIEGFNIVAGIDADPTCRFAYTTNNNAEFLLKDVITLTADEITALYPEGDTRVLVGCAPCQPFSRYTNNKSENDKWSLVDRFAQLTCEALPDVVSMENVPELARHQVFADFVAALEKTKYHVSWSVVNCLDYGIPQTRHRLVLFASRLGPISIIPKTHRPDEYRKVRDVISGLEKLEAGQVSTRDPLHRTSKLSDLNLRRIKATPEGGGWRDWPEEIRLECHKKKTGETYPSVYGRMNWNEPAPTMTTQCHGLGNGRFGHPDQNRAISLREAALFQTFPKEYQFVDPNSPFVITWVARHIGNAVPVRLGQVIAMSIKKHLELHYA